MDRIGRALRIPNILIYNLLFWVFLTVLELIKTLSFRSNFTIDLPDGFYISWPVAPFLLLWALSLASFQGFIYLRSFDTRKRLSLSLAFSFFFGIVFSLGAPIVTVLLERLFLGFESTSAKILYPDLTKLFYDFIVGVAIFWGLYMLLSGIDYYRKFQDEIAKGIELEKELSGAKLDAMKMQLHPHFIFNAFNTISMMIRQKKNNSAVEMVASLSDMLRLSLNRETSQFLTLKEEIELVKKYLHIEKERFKDRVEISWKLDDSIMDRQVPSLILQPLVENAFKHGISKNPGQSELIISTKAKNDSSIFIEVYNSGPKFYGEINSLKQTGIGLHNTTSRLLKLYEKNFKFLVKQRENGVSMILELPVKGS